MDRSVECHYLDIYLLDLETGESRDLTNSASDDFDPVGFHGLARGLFLSI